MSRRMDGATALVTGASSGIGWEIARALAERGALTVVSARREDRLNRLASLIEQAGSVTPVVIAADLSIRGAAAELASRVRERLGPIDILVNNAGSGVGGTVWAVGDRDEARAALEVDYWSPLALIHEFVPDMRRRGNGTIVNVTSLRQVFSWPAMGHSSAANAALAIATETLRLELLRFEGVHVIDVVPGPINTPSQGPTKLLPGIVQAVHDRFGTAEPAEVAARLMQAIENSEPYVFCPESARPAFEDPVSLRQSMRDAVHALADDAPVDDAYGDFLDTFVVGNDDDMLVDARHQWEIEHDVVR